MLIDERKLISATERLKNGGLVAFPTETVYGLGGNAYRDDVVEKIFRYKNRPPLNPINVCYSSFARAATDVEINDLAERLAETFLPGPLTIVLRKKSSSKISRLCTPGKASMGVRVPQNDLALKLLSAVDFPLAAPSANVSTKLSTTTPQSVAQNFSQYPDLLIIDGGKCKFGLESTIVDLSEEEPVIVRLGALTQNQLEEVCHCHFQRKSERIVKHYQTSKPLITDAMEVGPNDALLAFGEPIPGSKYCLNLSPRGDLWEAAKNLFDMLQTLDASDADCIKVMPIPNEDVGKSINEILDSAKI